MSLRGVVRPRGNLGDGFCLPTVSGWSRNDKSKDNQIPMKQILKGGGLIEKI